MTVNLEETVKQLSDFLKTEAKTESVIGQSFQLGEFTCIPVIKFGIGIGMEEEKVMATWPVKEKEKAEGRAAAVA